MLKNKRNYNFRIKKIKMNNKNETKELILIATIED